MKNSAWQMGTAMVFYTCERRKGQASRTQEAPKKIKKNWKKYLTSPKACGTIGASQEAEQNRRASWQEQEARRLTVGKQARGHIADMTRAKDALKERGERYRVPWKLNNPAQGYTLVYVQITGVVQLHKVYCIVRANRYYYRQGSKSMGLSVKPSIRTKAE